MKLECKEKQQIVKTYNLSHFETTGVSATNRPQRS